MRHFKRRASGIESDCIHDRTMRLVQVGTAFGGFLYWLMKYLRVYNGTEAPISIALRVQVPSNACLEPIRQLPLPKSQVLNYWVHYIDPPTVPLSWGTSVCRKTALDIMLGTPNKGDAYCGLGRVRASSEARVEGLPRPPKYPL